MLYNQRLHAGVFQEQTQHSGDDDGTPFNQVFSSEKVIVDIAYSKVEYTFRKFGMN